MLPTSFRSWNPRSPRSSARVALGLAALFLALGCASSGAATGDDPPELLGPLDRAAIEAAVPEWVEQTASSEVDPAAAEALLGVPQGATVTVFLGTWCGDSRREVSRFWQALDTAGVMGPEELPFELTYLGVDGDKTGPEELVAGRDIRYVPTFIVERDGREVGRIVESSPQGIEVDLLALLTGEASGLVTDKEELLEEMAAEGGAP